MLGEPAARDEAAFTAQRAQFKDWREDLRQREADLAAARELLDDPDMKAFAQEEIAEARERIEALGGTMQAGAVRGPSRDSGPSTGSATDSEAVPELVVRQAQRPKK